MSFLCILFLFVIQGSLGFECSRARDCRECITSDCVFGVDFDHFGHCLTEEEAEDIPLSKVIHSISRCERSAIPLNEKKEVIHKESLEDTTMSSIAAVTSSTPLPFNNIKKSHIERAYTDSEYTPTTVVTFTHSTRDENLQQSYSKGKALYFRQSFV